ncbi:MAG: AmmeMemoRadiSam system protein B [Candidatus Omnitrophica bacterium]|nr:AmmeMemoRadiSam system protein B [Candidatus Omnitrophota bacterium]
MCGAWLVFAQPALAAQEARSAQVAGSFYPADPTELRATVEGLLARAAAPDSAAPLPRILLLPHAGYAYSGPIAAEGFRRVQGQRYDAVIVVGFTHRQQFPGSSVDDRSAYQTPLGAIPIDERAAAFLRGRAGFGHVEAAHAGGEHSMEVMLPFLQVAVPDLRVVPVVMGSADLADATALAEALAALDRQGRYLFVFSTDLSHYHPYEQAVEQDELTVNAVLVETPQALHRLLSAGALEACGRGPILASVELARRLGYLERKLLRYANSGDTTGDTSRVVGYAALGMHERTDVVEASGGLAVSQEAGRALVREARAVLERYFASPSAAVQAPALAGVQELQRAAGLFVTLRRRSGARPGEGSAGRAGELRGCIGRIENTSIPLAQLLPTVALDAALRDGRFQPLTAAELPEVTVEVSVLSPLRPIRRPQEIVAGRDGVVLQSGTAGGVFLPQVWQETGWTRVEFLRELAHQKAGLDPDAWQQAQLFTFRDQAFSEERD